MMIDEFIWYYAYVFILVYLKILYVMKQVFSEGLKAEFQQFTEGLKTKFQGFTVWYGMSAVFCDNNTHKCTTRVCYYHQKLN